MLIQNLLVAAVLNFKRLMAAGRLILHLMKTLLRPVFELLRSTIEQVWNAGTKIVRPVIVGLKKCLTTASLSGRWGYSTRPRAAGAPGRSRAGVTR